MKIIVIGGTGLIGSKVVTKLTNSIACGPVTMNSPMCETSNSPHPWRTALCSAVMPVGYCTGIS